MVWLMEHERRQQKHSTVTGAARSPITEGTVGAVREKNSNRDQEEEEEICVIRHSVVVIHNDAMAAKTGCRLSSYD
jgi:hypothetical protein